MAKQKRGYSREFPIEQTRRIKREIDWVPPALDRSLRAKLKRDGISLRALTLRLWKQWVEAPEPPAGTRRCPSCGSAKQERIAGLWLCSACDHEWDDKPEPPAGTPEAYDA